MKIEKILGSQNKLLSTTDGSANFIISLVLMFLVQFVFIVLLMMAKIDYDSFTSAFIGTCIICLVNETGFILAPLAYSKIKDNNCFKDMGFKFNLNIVVILLCVLIALATISFSAPLANWFVDFIIKTGFDSSVLASMEIKSVGDMVLGLIFLSLVPAVVEEILFRGVIARSFKSKGIFFAIFMSAFLFAIMHGSPIQLVHQFVLGVICCLVYFITRQIYAPIIIHFTNNAVSIIGSYILYKQGQTEASTDVLTSVILIIIGAIALVGLMYLLIRYYSNKNENVKSASSFKAKLAVLAISEHEKELIKLENENEEEKLEQLDSDEAKEIYKLTMKEKRQKAAHIERRSLIYAIGVGLAIWIIQTVVAYL